MKRLKQKESNLLVPAKLHAPVKYTASERIKLTLQNYRLENKSIKSEIQQMKFEIENKSLDIKDNSLHNDFVSIMSNADNSKTPPPPVHEIFLGGTTEIPLFFKNWCSLSPYDNSLLFRSSCKISFFL